MGIVVRPVMAWSTVRTRRAYAASDGVRIAHTVPATAAPRPMRTRTVTVRGTVGTVSRSSGSGADSGKTWRKRSRA